MHDGHLNLFPTTNSGLYRPQDNCVQGSEPFCDARMTDIRNFPLKMQTNGDLKNFGNPLPTEANDLSNQYVDRCTNYYANAADFRA